MPEFILKYKVPESVFTDREEEEFALLVHQMAEAVQALIGSRFFGWSVSYDTRELEMSDGMPDFKITVWVLDNEDRLQSLVEQVQPEIIKTMQGFATEYQTVGCSFQRVKGKWGQARGLKEDL